MTNKNNQNHQSSETRKMQKIIAHETYLGQPHLNIKLLNKNIFKKNINS